MCYISLGPMWHLKNKEKNKRNIYIIGELKSKFMGSKIFCINSRILFQINTWKKTDFVQYWCLKVNNWKIGLSGSFIYFWIKVEKIKPLIWFEYFTGHFYTGNQLVGLIQNLIFETTFLHYLPLLQLFTQPNFKFWIGFLKLLVIIRTLG